MNRQNKAPQPWGLLLGASCMALLSGFGSRGSDAAAQSQPPPASPPAATNGTPARVTLDVVVTPKSGVPMAGLNQSDFRLLVDKAERPLTGFRAVTAGQEPLQVVIVLDAVNTSYEHLGFERQQLGAFLRANGGHLAQPTSLAIFTDDGTQLQAQPTTDGTGLNASLDNYMIGLRTIRRSSMYHGEDQVQLSLQALEALAAKEAALPGRKLILWVSPGWPMLSGPEIFLDDKEMRSLFATVTTLSMVLRQGNITLYGVDPLGTEEGIGREYYYEDFLKGVSKVGDVQIGNLSLQVLAVQSGGMALSASNDVAALMQRCVADAKAYYDISFDAPAAVLGEKGDRYHTVEVKLDRPGLTARTRTGFYLHP